MVTNAPPCHCVQSAAQRKAGERHGARERLGKQGDGIDQRRQSHRGHRADQGRALGQDLKALQTIMTLSKMKGRYPNVDAAIADNLALLAAPRLHRSP